MIELTTDLALADLHQAITASLPGKGYHAAPDGEGAVALTFDDTRVTATQVRNAVSAWTGADALLARAKAAKIAAVQARRAVAVLAFVWNGHPVPLTDKTKSDIGNAVQGLTLKADGSKIPWEIEDGLYVDLGLADLTALGLAGLAFEQACYANSKALSLAINAGADLDTLGDIDLDAGWPA